MLSSNINEQTDREELSPLMIAVKGKNADCVSKLLELGAKIDLEDREGKTVYHYAVLYNPEVIRVSRQIQCIYICQIIYCLLCISFKLKYTEFMEIIILHQLLAENNQSSRRDKIIDCKNRKGRTALWCACQNSKSESVALLLDAGANPNITDNDNIYPIFLALKEGDNK